MIEVTKLEEVKSKSGVSCLFVGSKACQPCSQMKLYIEKVAKDCRVNLFYADADKVTPILREAVIRGLPTLVLYKDGQVIGRRSGFLSEQKLREFLRG